LTTADLTIAEHRFKRPSIFQKVCAHEIAELSAEAWKAYRRSDFGGAIRLFEQIHGFDSENPGHLLGLMYGCYRMDNYVQAGEWAAKIVTHSKASVKQIAEANDVQGDINWQARKYETAQTFYQNVFDLHASHALDREAQAKLATLALESSTARIRIRQVLIDQKSRTYRMNLLHEVINEIPEWGLAFYLAGRQLHSDQKYAASNDCLVKAAAFGLPHRSLEIENTRLFALNLYHLRQYEQAISQFHRLAEDEVLPIGVALNAADWIKRCEWEKQKGEITQLRN